jgi:hypothetical protein
MVHVFTSDSGGVRPARSADRVTMQLTTCDVQVTSTTRDDTT